MSSGWAVGAIFFGEVGLDVERLETGLLAGHDGRSDRAVDADAVFTCPALHSTLMDCDYCHHAGLMALLSMICTFVPGDVATKATYSLKLLSSCRAFSLILSRKMR